MRATMSLYRRGGRGEEGREERHARACTSPRSCKLMQAHAKSLGNNKSNKCKFEKKKKKWVKAL